VGLENYQRCPECGSIATASSLVYDGKRDTFTFLGYRCFSCEATWNDRLTNDRESQ
jgi:formate dehydrogenase maturation protein FdhE